jgi:hypothetical protein
MDFKTSECHTGLHNSQIRDETIGIVSRNINPC